MERKSPSLIGYAEKKIKRRRRGEPVKQRYSIKKNHEFRRIYARGRSAVSGLLVLYCQRNRAGGSRLGITVGAKVGKAVVRNRVRRRIREIYRLHAAQLQPGWDLIVVARGRAASAEYAELTRAFLRLCDKLSLWEEKR